ncbi:hypothetical protein SLU01_02450 [Sporosarcina luteola]|uniref:DUF3886 domain-containing protein n=1 Tax=Sporosarcina luteola TaxID=582850 RepID=A0A511Z3B0_9BACL|nr:YqkE family protein [Sporosarcina luteola]GEN81933.1 hypothetical protein SLU01_02450 [Sporosarcina luteola]
MARKKAAKKPTPKRQENDKSVLSDALSDDVLQKLKAAKKELTANAEAKEAERLEKLRLEKLEREKNKSFAELLDEYGDGDTKF